MLMALETDTVDFICTDMPTAMGAVAAYPDMKILDFTDSDDNFEGGRGRDQHRHLRDEGQHRAEGGH